MKKKFFSKEACQFGYRDSFFKSSAGREWVVVFVTFTLLNSPQPKLEYGALQELAAASILIPQQIRNKIIEIRSGKFPDWHKVGTAGSFFKNPAVPNEQFLALQKRFPGLPGYPAGTNHTKLSLGWVLDHVCQLRGYCKDGVCLFEKQALVLVNVGAVDANTIDVFANEVAAIVEEKTGIEIEREVRSV